MNKTLVSLHMTIYDAVMLESADGCLCFVVECLLVYSSHQKLEFKKMDTFVWMLIAIAVFSLGRCIIYVHFIDAQ